jgi:hypothetical protein
VALVVLGFLVVVGGAVGFVLYDRATAIDRSTPDIAVDQFLHASAVERDVSRTSLFVCAEWSARDAVAAATDELDPEVVVSWSAISVSVTSERTAQASTDVRLTVDGFSDIERWRFALEQQGGWRVCSLRREASTETT